MGITDWTLDELELLARGMEEWFDMQADEEDAERELMGMHDENVAEKKSHRGMRPHLSRLHDPR